MFYHNSFAIDKNVKTPLTELSVLEVGFSFAGVTPRGGRGATRVSN